MDDLYEKYCMKCKWCYACYDDNNSDLTEEEYKECFEEE